MFVILQIFFATCGNRQDLPLCHMSYHVKVCQLAAKISTSSHQISLQSKAFVGGKGKTFERKVNLFNSVIWWPMAITGKIASDIQKNN